MPKQGHFVVVPMAAWGHVRPLLHLSLNLLAQHQGLHLSLVLSPSVLGPVEKELASSSFSHAHTAAPSQQPLAERLQLLVVNSPKLAGNDEFHADLAQEAMEYAQAIPSYLASLFSGADTVDGTKDPNRFAKLKPNLIIYDMFQGFVPDVATKVFETLHVTAVPLLCFCPCNAVATYNHFAPSEKHGTLALMIERAAKEIKGGMSVDEAYSKWGYTATGAVIEPPGLGKMYDYELYPGAGTVPVPTQILRQLGSALAACRHPATTAFLVPTTPELEPEAKAAFEQVIGKELIMSGIQFPETVWRGNLDIEKTQSAEDQRVIDFLDSMEQKHGKGKVLYFSFGSAWFPILRPELVFWLLESLWEHNIPFVFAHASFLEQLPRELLDKVNAHEESIEVKFAPQWAVLNHPATGYFLSHCGSNSTAEAILAEKPIVAFPFAADQGEFTAMLVKLGCAIELKQVKSFKPTTYNRLYDGTVILGTEGAVKDELKGVWAKLLGPEGQQIRKNVSDVRARLMQSWEKGGAKHAMESFERYF